MNRRRFFKVSTTAAAGFALPGITQAQVANPSWRTFKLSYDIELPGESAPAQVWLPIPETQISYQQAMGGVWRGTAEEGEFREEPSYGAGYFYARWRKTIPYTAEITTHFRTADRAVDLSAYQPQSRTRIPVSVAKFMRPTRHMPQDGIVLATAKEITRGATHPLEKARAIYDWVVDNTFRDPKIQGCGRGDIKFMLESGNLGGKCADINSLFVGLARTAGIPAREKFGIRVADSALFKCLGKTGDISKAQHCRAEFYLAGLGWVPVDPADIRKAVLEENLSITDPQIRALREKLFGSWEMNWVGFNHGRDFSMLPRHASSSLNFFMYPHGEVAGVPRESLDPPSFKYKIVATELV